MNLIDIVIYVIERHEEAYNFNHMVRDGNDLSRQVFENLDLPPYV